MSRVQHNRVLPTTFSFAVYMFLLIHLGYSGFYGSDCRRSCWGHCFNGRCALLASGRAVNCTEGCVLGWRGLTCTTRCKRPCLKCDRNTGDCVGQCRDGFCGAGCLQRCPNKSYVMPRTLKLTHALGQTHGTEKEGSNPNPCAEKFTNTCVKCNECNECREGYYGSSCEKKCIGHCQYDCDIQTGLCRTCQDGFHGDNCSVPCSNTCFENACERSTGACNGCKEGYCSPYTGCEQSCDRNCSTCDFETCKCLTPASQDTTSPTSSSKGSLLTGYWVGSSVNTVYLVIFFIILRCKLWNSLKRWCDKTENEQNEPGSGDPLSGTRNEPRNNEGNDETNTGTSCCNPVQSPKRKATLLALIICVLVYVFLNVIACVIIYRM
ncbi:scavenger receptor class F member 1-like isoform X2 [Haliotis asinina]